MKILPKCGRDWFALFLLPFKVFAPTGWLMLEIKRGLIGYRMDTDTNLAMFVIGGSFISFWILVLGALIQLGIGTRKDFLSTCGFIIALFFFGFLESPYMAHTLEMITRFPKLLEMKAVANGSPAGFKSDGFP
jgi:hypothetical protein